MSQSPHAPTVSGFQSYSSEAGISLLSKVFLSNQTSETQDIFGNLFLNHVGRQRILFSPRRYFFLPRLELIVSRCGSHTLCLGGLSQSFAKGRDDSPLHWHLAKQRCILLASEIRLHLAPESELLRSKCSLDRLHEHLISCGEPYAVRAGGDWGLRQKFQLEESSRSGCATRGKNSKCL